MDKKRSIGLRLILILIAGILVGYFFMINQFPGPGSEPNSHWDLQWGQDELGVQDRFGAVSSDDGEVFTVVCQLQGHNGLDPEFESKITAPEYSENVMIMQVDRTGNFLDAAYIPGVLINRPVITSGKTYILVNDGDRSRVFYRIGTDLETELEQEFENLDVQCLQVGSNGMIFIAGSSASATGINPMERNYFLDEIEPDSLFLIKLDKRGTFEIVKTIIKLENDESFAAVDSIVTYGANLYILGQFRGSIESEIMGESYLIEQISDNVFIGHLTTDGLFLELDQIPDCQNLTFSTTQGLVTTDGSTLHVLDLSIEYSRSIELIDAIKAGETSFSNDDIFIGGQYYGGMAYANNSNACFMIADLDGEVIELTQWGYKNSHDMLIDFAVLEDSIILLGYWGGTFHLTNMKLEY